MEQDQITRNLVAQRKLYGEPLYDGFRRTMDTLGLSQARLASVLGLSAPMLSQLGSGRRVKIGNPAVLQRMDELTLLVERVRSGRVELAAAISQLDRIRAVTGHLSRSDTEAATTTEGSPDSSAEDFTRDAVVIRNLLRELASGCELRAAAELLGPTQPRLAELLRVYGLGSVHDAAEHLRRHNPTIRTVRP
ncbi:putative transcriptional regulator [Rhodococcus sp. 27YEA15]|uniref:DNA-binding protein n=1 Tax=Rhodococcus sp. 27YEA15 TaxID=3156259 RepID=UPI003C7CE856